MPSFEVTSLHILQDLLLRFSCQQTVVILYYNTES